MSSNQNHEIAVEVKDLHKSFRLPHEQHSGIKQSLINIFNSKKGYEEQKVLKGVSFEIQKGDFFGIVGRNGSGKSTLLKLLAGIYAPDKGFVQVNGSLTPFIELGVGFNPELTGRENVYMNGALLGFDRKQMDGMYDSIVEFAELTDFMDQKLKNYSSGMQVRLAFSIAIRAESDILLLDEVLAVGDEAFQRKCFEYFAELKKNKKTVILVTHNMDHVKQFCTKAMLIDKGHKTVIGTPSEITQIYQELNKAEETNLVKEKGQTTNKYVEVNTKLDRKNGNIVVDMDISPKVAFEEPILLFVIYKDTGELVYRWSSGETNLPDVDLNRKLNLNLEIQDIFPVGSFYASLYIRNQIRTVLYANFEEIASFKKPPSEGSSNSDLYWKPEQKFSIKNTNS